VHPVDEEDIVFEVSYPAPGLYRLRRSPVGAPDLDFAVVRSSRLHLDQGGDATHDVTFLLGVPTGFEPMLHLERVNRALRRAQIPKGDR
jgi:hypothetical protein